MTDVTAVVSIVSSAVVGVAGVGATLRAAVIAVRGSHKQEKRAHYDKFQTSLSQVMMLSLPPRGDQQREAELARTMVLVQTQLVSLPLVDTPSAVKQAAVMAARTMTGLATVPPSKTVEEAQSDYVALITAMQDDLHPGWRKRARWRHPSRWLHPGSNPALLGPASRPVGDSPDAQPDTAAPGQT